MRAQVPSLHPHHARSQEDGPPCLYSLLDCRTIAGASQGYRSRGRPAMEGFTWGGTGYPPALKVSAAKSRVMPGGSRTCRRRELTLISVLLPLALLHSCLLHLVPMAVGTGPSLFCSLLNPWCLVQGKVLRNIASPMAPNCGTWGGRWKWGWNILHSRQTSPSGAVSCLQPLQTCSGHPGFKSWPLHGLPM